MGPVNNNPASVQKMAQQQTGNIPLSKPVIVYFTDASMHHLAPVLQRIEFGHLFSSTLNYDYALLSNSSANCSIYCGLILLLRWLRNGFE